MMKTLNKPPEENKKIIVSISCSGYNGRSSCNTILLWANVVYDVSVTDSALFQNSQLNILSLSRDYTQIMIGEMMMKVYHPKFRNQNYDFLNMDA